MSFLPISWQIAFRQAIAIHIIGNSPLFAGINKEYKLKMSNNNLFRSAAFLLLLLFVIVSCKPTQDLSFSKSQSTNCVLDAEYRALRVHSVLDTCFLAKRTFYGDYLTETGSYGYEVVNDLELVRYLIDFPEEAYEFQAIEVSPINIKFIDFSKFTNLKLLRLLDFEEFPTDIYGIPDLKVLSIVSRNLTSIPDGIAALNALEVLEVVFGENLTYITKELTELSSLKILELDNIGKIQDLNFNKLTNLQRLIMFDCDLINPSISGCLQLKYLTVDLYEDYFADLPNLETLAIYDASKNQNFASIERATKLKELYLSEYNNPKIEEAISNIQNLEFLSIEFAYSVEELHLKELAFKKLKYLYIHSKNLIAFPEYEAPNLYYLEIVSPDNELEEVDNIEEILAYENLNYLNLLIRDRTTTELYYEKLKGSSIKLLDFFE